MQDLCNYYAKSWGITLIEIVRDWKVEIVKELFLIKKWQTDIFYTLSLCDLLGRGKNVQVVPSKNTKYEDNISNWYFICLDINIFLWSLNCWPLSVNYDTSCGFWLHSRDSVDRGENEFWKVLWSRLFY